MGVRGVWRIKHWLWQRRQARALRSAEQAIQRFPTIGKRTPHGLTGDLIVSLTSYPARFPTLAKTIRSLLDQTAMPDRTILWLGHGNKAGLPGEVLTLVSHGLDIRECTDIRSFTKIIPTLRAYPDAFVVTADDDIYYPPTWLQTLVEKFDNNDPAIIVHRAHMATLTSDGRLTPYASWEFDTQARTDNPPHQLLFPTGVGGILYPPNSLGEDVLNESLFLRLCPTADDLWLFWMAERARTPHRRVSGKIELAYWDGSQDTGLVHHNVGNNGNDAQIRSLEAHFGLLI